MSLGEAIGQMLPSAVGVAISPLPIVAVVLMLVTERGRANGPLILLGWIVGVAGAGAILLAVASSAGAHDEGEPADWVSWLKLLLGLGLVFLAAKQWRGRPHEGEQPVTPKWMGTLDSFTPPKAGGAGILLSAVSPKNLLLIVAGMAAIAQTGISTGDQAIALILFTLVASIGVGIPVVIYFALGDRSDELLARLKDWMARNNDVIMAVLLLVIGVKLIGDAITGFSS
jgi:threonine/homoserine/homoserine lactone efflux protein